MCRLTEKLAIFNHCLLFVDFLTEKLHYWKDSGAQKIQTKSFVSSSWSWEFVFLLPLLLMSAQPWRVVCRYVKLSNSKATLSKAITRCLKQYCFCGHYRVFKNKAYSSLLEIIIWLFSGKSKPINYNHFSLKDNFL